MTTADIVVSVANGVHTVERADLGIVAATFHRQGSWRVRLYTTDTEYISRSYATREAAESVAIGHAEGLA